MIFKLVVGYQYQDVHLHDGARQEVKKRPNYSRQIAGVGDFREESSRKITDFKFEGATTIVSVVC